MEAFENSHNPKDSEKTGVCTCRCSCMYSTGCMRQDSDRYKTHLSMDTRSIGVKLRHVCTQQPTGDSRTRHRPEDVKRWCPASGKKVRDCRHRNYKQIKKVPAILCKFPKPIHEHDGQKVDDKLPKVLQSLLELQHNTTHHAKGTIPVV